MALVWTYDVLDRRKMTGRNYTFLLEMRIRLLIHNQQRHLLRIALDPFDNIVVRFRGNVKPVHFHYAVVLFQSSGRSGRTRIDLSDVLDCLVLLGV